MHEIKLEKFKKQHRVCTKFHYFQNFIKTLKKNTQNKFRKDKN